jgi:hypothetical protein
MGYHADQTTLSLDLKALGAKKHLEETGVCYRVAIPDIPGHVVEYFLNNS